ncbi:acetylxylan esterase [Pseudolysinimonas sp.]|uniref:acetylxylan esterase n=1 Tax=Pseudolysinimonas sp. TaxID=2680009 RepID=UPI003F7E74A7
MRTTGRRDVDELAGVLGVRTPPRAPEVSVDDRWAVDDVTVSALSWSVGFGPQTRAYLVTPRDGRGRLPGVLGLHCHGGTRSLGADQLVDLGLANSTHSIERQLAWYGRLGAANRLAARGFAVLVHDAFSWASRRFDLTRPGIRLEETLTAYAALWRDRGITPTPEDVFDLASSLHEDTLAKACGLLDTTFAGAVAFDDLVALDVLAGLDVVDPTRVASFGFSGGGGRSVLLSALDERVRASVVTCMMATFDSLFPRYLDVHSWLLNSPGLPGLTDWPDVVPRGAARRTLVQYGWRDPLFPEEGMLEAHERLRGVEGYRGSFHDVDHVFDPAMQDEAWRFLEETLAG